MPVAHVYAQHDWIGLISCGFGTLVRPDMEMLVCVAFQLQEHSRLSEFNILLPSIWLPLKMLQSPRSPFSATSNSLLDARLTSAYNSKYLYLVALVHCLYFWCFFCVSSSTFQSKPPATIGFINFHCLNKMSSYGNLYPQYVQPSSYVYHDRELDSHDDYFAQEPRYMHDRHASQDFSSYPDEDTYYSGYKAESGHSSSRHYAPAMTPAHGVPVAYDHTSRHSSYSTSPTVSSGSSMSRHASSGGGSPVVDRLVSCFHHRDLTAYKLL